MRALVLIAALLGTSAHATWTSTTVTGTPRDVSTADAGQFVVATSGGPGAVVYLVGADGGLTSSPPLVGNYVSAVLRGPCLMGLTPPTNAAIVFDVNCASDAYTYNFASGRLRPAANGAVYGYSWTNTSLLTVRRLDALAPTGLSNWTNVALSTLAPNGPAPLAVVSLDGGEWVGVSSSTDGLVVIKDSVNQGIQPGGFVRDVTLFDLDGKPAAIAAMDGGSLVFSGDLSVANSGFTVVSSQGPFNSVSFGAWGNSAYGRGFGMATAGTQIYSAVPNPNAIGQQWVARVGAGVPTNLVRISCADPTFCAGIAVDGGQNVWAYVNRAAPSAVPGVAVVPAGGSAPYLLDAGDADGDPIWVTWTDGGFFWDGVNPRAITVLGPPPGACGMVPMAPPVTGVISDGLPAHDRPFTINVTVTSAGGAPAVLSAMPTSLSFTAGGAAKSVTASFPADSGCGTPSLTWSIAPDGGQFALSQQGDTASVTPPQFFCQPLPGTFSLSGVGMPDASVSIPITLAPWGQPKPPYFTPDVVIQRAGTSADYAPDASTVHFCEGAGFPGTDLAWTVDAGSVPGVTVTTGPSLLTITSTNACVSGTVTAQPRRRVIGLPLQSAQGGTFTVQIQRDLAAITSSTPFDAGFSYAPAMSELSGSFSSGATCLSDRDLRAQVTVTSSDGGVVSASPGVAVPGPWSLTFPGCSGGSFVATASLIDDAGVRYGAIASYAFDAGRIEARVPALNATDVPVTCAEGARGVLDLDVRPSDCSLQQYGWKQDRGPLLITAPDGGARVSFATAINDLQVQAGQELEWSITAFIDPTNTATASRSIRLVPAPFVQIVHRTDVPVAREEEAVGVEVILTNPTACPVSGVTLRESLGGLELVPGSVRVDGAKWDAALVDDVLEVAQLSLPASTSIQVTYLANVPLLSLARPSGRVLLTGTDVTVAAVPQPAAGCGCASSASAGFALWALLAALVRSRRRSG